MAESVHKLFLQVALAALASQVPQASTVVHHVFTHK